MGRVYVRGETIHMHTNEDGLEREFYGLTVELFPPAFVTAQHVFVNGKVTNAVNLAQVAICGLMVRQNAPQEIATQVPGTLSSPPILAGEHMGSFQLRFGLPLGAGPYHIFGFASEDGDNADAACFDHP